MSVEKQQPANRPQGRITLLAARARGWLLARSARRYAAAGVTLSLLVAVSFVCVRAQMLSRSRQTPPERPTLLLALAALDRGPVLSKPASETDILAGLIQRRHARLRQLRELGRRQLDLIASQDLSHLLTVLAAKQRAPGELQASERSLDPFRKQDPGARQWRSPADREHCARLVSDCESMLAEIVAQEQQSEIEMRQQRDQVSQSLHHVHAAGAARGAYVAETHPAFSQLDLPSET